MGIGVKSYREYAYIHTYDSTYDLGYINTYILFKILNFKRKNKGDPPIRFSTI